MSIRTWLQSIGSKRRERLAKRSALETRVAESQAHVDDALAALKEESARDAVFSQQIVNQLGRVIGHKE
jgi:hypothetical protein